MNLLTKIKLALSARKPAEAVIGNLKEIRSGYQTWHFWVVLFGNLVALAGALSGVLAPQYAMVAMVVLTTLYNLARGAEKSQQPGVKPWYKTTEGWMSLGVQVAAAVASIQAGGVNPAWLASAGVILTGATAMARDLSNHQPTDVLTTAIPPTPPTTTP